VRHLSAGRLPKVEHRDGDGTIALGEGTAVGWQNKFPARFPVPAPVNSLIHSLLGGEIYPVRGDGKSAQHHEISRKNAKGRFAPGRGEQFRHRAAPFSKTRDAATMTLDKSLVLRTVLQR
jgi:hypothetical protein